MNLSIQKGRSYVQAERNFRALILDLDGTLLSDSKEISRKNLEAIDSLKAIGVKIALFTGRDFELTRRYIDVLELEGPHALQNGAIVVTGDGSVLESRSVGRDICYHVIESAFDRQCDVLLRSSSSSVPNWFHRGPFIENPYLPFLQHNSERTSFVTDLNSVIESENILQLDVTGPFEELRGLLEKLESLFQSGFSYSLLRTSEDLGFMETFWADMEDGPVLNEIMSKVDRWGLLSLFGRNVSKGEALDKFLQYHAFSAEEIVFIGDHFADISLMKRVGLAIAVKNAFEEVKAACHLETTSNNDNGVAEAIDRVFFHNQGAGDKG